MISKKIPTTPLWAQEREKVLYDITRCKFEQNEDLKRKLLDTQNLILYEATRDRKFGVGYPVKMKAKINASSPGQNIAGKTLMKIRDELKK